VKRRRIVVSGRVQGVFYRATCARMAREAGLGGSIRNLPGGGVEAVFEGPDEAVDAIVEWCRHGPDLARVDEIDILAEEPIGDSTFRVTG
jgi:acylphosphatase